MSTVYVIAYVPAAAKPQGEADLAPLLGSKNRAGVDTLSVPLSPTGAAPATHYGFCCADKAGGRLVAGMARVKAARGGDFQVVPFRQYQYARDWLGWLAARGLKPVVAKVP